MGFKITNLEQPLPLELADRVVREGGIQHGVTLSASIPSSGLHFFTPAVILERLAFDCILGIDWVAKYAQFINWSARTVSPPETVTVATAVLPTKSGFPAGAPVPDVLVDNTNPMDVFVDTVDSPEYMTKLKGQWSFTCVLQTGHQGVTTFSSRF
jgi:hypothetical protein